MSETKFTPGPWELSNVCSCDDDGDCERPSPGIDIVALAADGVRKAVVRVENGPLGLPHEANADLIATAPDLYAAAAGMIDFYDNKSGRIPATDHVIYVRALRAALAKARGER